MSEQNYTVPSPIQAQAIPPLLEGRDLLGCAQTGTGKTAAFSLPILNALHENPQLPRPKCPRVLVLTPTRELATQVGKSLATYGKHVDVRHALVFGGVSQHPQVKALKGGTDVLVACPGRLLDLIGQKHIDLSHVEFFVLDEVDRMLDMGFRGDVDRIVALIPKRRQSLFFSATLAPPIVELAHTILKNPVSVTIAPETTTAENVEQKVYFLTKDAKRGLIIRLLQEQRSGELAIVFVRTKHGADKLCKFIVNSGITAEAIHGDRSQPQRDKTLNRFRAGALPVLVATDVAARGVDVKDITLVVNHDLPNEPEAYVHRIGRTGRAGATGHAVSFCSEDEVDFLQEIEKLIGEKIPVDRNHKWHSSELAAIHARGKKTGKHPQRKKDPGAGGDNSPKRPKRSGRRPGGNNFRRSRRKGKK